LGTYRGFNLWAYERPSGWLGYAVHDVLEADSDPRVAAALVAWCPCLETLRDELVLRINEYCVAHGIA
jgi:hypothetical protein